MFRKGTSLRLIVYDAKLVCDRFLDSVKYTETLTIFDSISMLHFFTPELVYRLAEHFRFWHRWINTLVLTLDTFLMTYMLINPSLLITGLKLCREEIPNILESFSQRHNTRVTCDCNLSLANLFTFLQTGGI